MRKMATFTTILFSCYVVGFLVGGISCVPPPLPTTLVPTETRLGGSLCSHSGCRCAHQPVQGLHLACSCEATEEPELVFSHATVPSTVASVEVYDCPRLLIQSGTFAHRNLLISLRTENVGNVTVQTHAFDGVRTGVELTFVDSEFLHFHMSAFRDFRGEVRVNVTNVDVLIVDKSSLGCPNSIHLEDIGDVRLHANSFHFDANLMKTGARPSVEMVRCRMDTLPVNVFPSSLSKVRFRDCAIGTVQPSAFSPYQVDTIHFHNTSVSAFEPTSFSEKTLIDTLIFTDVSIQRLQSDALRSAVANFTMAEASIQEISAGAFNSTVASMTLRDSSVARLHPRSFMLNMWNHLVIEGNHFDMVDHDTFAYMSPSTASQVNLTFARNQIGYTQPGALHFKIPDSVNLVAVVTDNVFDRLCGCDGGNWLRSLLNPSPPNRLPDGQPVEFSDDLTWFLHFYNTSWCRVNPPHATCLGIDAEFLPLQNHTETVCMSHAAISACIQQAAAETESPSLETSTGSGDIARTMELESNKHILLIIFLAVVCSMAALCALLVLLYAQRRKSSGGRDGLGDTTGSAVLGGDPHHRHLLGCDPLLTSRTESIGDYNDVFGEKAKEPRDEASADDLSQMSCEDKAVQTMPDELTTELLQSLRERLDDPNSFGEAKDVIEHLYDLIKVEEERAASSRDVSRPDIMPEAENLEEYEPIVLNRDSKPNPRSQSWMYFQEPSECRVPKSNSFPPPHTTSTAVNTDDATSFHFDLSEPPDPPPVLSSNNRSRSNTPPVPPIPPYSQVNKPPSHPTLCEYTEPRDMPVHIYAEIPAHAVSSSGSSGIQRQSCGSGGGSGGSSSSIFRNPFTRKGSDSTNSSGRKSLWQYLGTGSDSRKNANKSDYQVPTVCEYADPTDAQVHLYAEVTSTTQLQKRPLPKRPDAADQNEEESIYEQLP